MNTPLPSYISVLYLPVAAITLTQDHCRKKNITERLKAWNYSVDGLTEVVGHQRRRRYRRLGELLSPATLLLQVLEDKRQMMEEMTLVHWALHVFSHWMIQYTSCQVYLTSVLTSRTDLKSFDIEASLDCEQQKTEQSYTMFIVQHQSSTFVISYQCQMWK